MKNLIRVSLLLAALTASVFGQLNTLTQTSLSGAVSASATTIVVASATNIAITSGSSNGSMLYILDPGQSVGELLPVTAISSTRIGVRRTGNAMAHVNGAMILVGQPQWFNVTDPKGSCVTASTFVTPYVNTTNGRQWLCSTVTLSWVPGWQNTSAPAAATLAVASAAGVILPSGPLFTSSGTAAITGFTVPVGFQSGGFCQVPTGAFTWTATNNIGLAGTAVVGRVLCWTYDQAAGKFYPSYV